MGSWTEELIMHKEQKNGTLKDTSICIGISKWVHCRQISYQNRKQAPKSYPLVNHTHVGELVQVWSVTVTYPPEAGVSEQQYQLFPSNWYCLETLEGRALLEEVDHSGAGPRGPSLAQLPSGTPFASWCPHKVTNCLTLQPPQNSPRLSFHQHGRPSTLKLWAKRKPLLP